MHGSASRAVNGNGTDAESSGEGIRSTRWPRCGSGSAAGAATAMIDPAAAGQVVGGQPRGVSILLATFNGERYLEELLASLVAQTSRPLELLVGDDGSDDATLEIVAGFARTAPFPVTFTRNTVRLGFADNFLTLARSAIGSVVAFCDQDDIWHPTKIERTSAWFDDPEVGLVLHRNLLIDERSRWRGRRFPSIRRTEVRGPRRVDPWFPCPGMAMVVRRSLLDQVDGRARPPSRDLDGHPMDHDEWAYLVSGTLASTVLLAEDLASYRQHFRSYLGAPAASWREQVQRGSRFGGRDYLRPRAEMYTALAGFWDRFAVGVGLDRAAVDRALASAAWYRRLAASQNARATVHDARVGRGKRATRAVRLVARGMYRSPIAGGAGGRALLGDLLDLVAAAPPAPVEISPDVAVRILEARAAGSELQAVAEALDRENVTPPFGQRWSAAMVRDVAFQYERRLERASGASAVARVDPSSMGSSLGADQGRPSS
jgi:rhamnosyltransferase